MPKVAVQDRSSRLEEQVKSLRTRLGGEDALSRQQVAEALAGLQQSLEELATAEQELAQQNEALVEAREALELERHRYRELFERLPVAYLVTDGKGKVETANSASAELFGIPEMLLRGKPLPVLVQVDDRSKLRSLIRKLGSGDAPLEAELRFVPRNASPRTVQVTVLRDEDKPGGRIRLLWVLRDISDRKEAEEALRAAEERLRHSQKLEAVGRLAGGIAHSFNNMLSAIALHAELLVESGGVTEEQRKHAEEIQAAGERAAALARQLLAFGRKQFLQPQALDVSGQLAGMAPMLRRLIGEHIELQARLDPKAGWICADLGQLEQVVLNLVVNARDAMPDGGQLRLEAAPVEVDGEEEDGVKDLPPGSYVKITVADTGIGMSDEVRARLFEPFFTTKDRDKGSGLGLATVYGIVHQSGGELQVESRIGGGSKFHLYLPRCEQPGEEELARVAPQEKTAGREVVLFVEDEANIREPAKEVLEARGYTVLAASDGAEAQEVLRQWGGPIDLLVTDVIMPGINGSQLADALCDEAPGLQVLYISGYPADAIARHGVLQPGRSFLHKPFPPGVLLRKVREVLDRGGACSTE
jgi:two-component system cell cycle sensor histidine kinase/response regulator CckA